MTALPAAALAATWRAGLADHTVVHLDAAGCACPSRDVLDATITHLRREAAVGGYAAEAEAAPTLASLRDRLGALVGLDGDAVALAPNATAAFTTLLAAWPLPTPARVATLRSDYESNRMALAALADRRPLEVVDLATDAAGHLDLDTLPHQLDGVDLVAFPVVASQRGVVQPAAAAVAVAHEAGIPIVLDVAQAAGHVSLVGVGADAYVGTARKWLRGPRGTGWIAAAAPAASRLRPEYPNLVGRDAAGVGQLATGEASIAARVGLAVALDELAAGDPEGVFARIAALGAAGPRPPRRGRRLAGPGAPGRALRDRHPRPPRPGPRRGRRPAPGGGDRHDAPSPRAGPPPTWPPACCGSPSTPTATPRILTAWSFHYGDSDNRLRA